MKCLNPVQPFQPRQAHADTLSLHMLNRLPFYIAWTQSDLQRASHSNPDFKEVPCKAVVELSGATFDVLFKWTRLDALMRAVLWEIFARRKAVQLLLQRLIWIYIAYYTCYG